MRIPGDHPPIFLRLKHQLDGDNMLQPPARSSLVVYPDDHDDLPV